MFKKILFAAVCAAMLGLATACSSVQIATDLSDMKVTTDDRYETVGHINAAIWGIYIFGFPLFSGSSRTNGSCRVFENTVTVNNAIQLLNGNAKAKFKCQGVIDIHTERYDRWLWPTIFFTYKSVQACGNIIK